MKWRKLKKGDPHEASDCSLKRSWSIRAPALTRKISYRSNGLLLFIDGDAADFLTVRASAFGSHRKSPTITGYRVGAGLNCFSGFRT